MVHVSFKTDRFTTGNGKINNVQEEESKSGLTVPFMKDNGTTACQTVKEDSFIQTEMFILESGKMIRHMDKEVTPTYKELCMLVVGSMINKVDMGRKNGLMGLNIEVNI